MWLDVAIAMSCASSGLVCGWIMHAIGGFEAGQLFNQDAVAGVDQDRSDPGSDLPTEQRITEVAARLQQHALSMAANVDAHQTKMQAVNNSLIEGGDTTPEAVLVAVNKLIEANQVMQSQLADAQERIHEQSEQLESAERRACTDALTRIPNRGAFDDHVAARHAEGSDAGTLALLDVDHFKKFNDVYGHLAGDEVLRVVAQVLNARLKSYGLVARYGGEEFAVILDGCPVDQAKDLIESARIAVSEREILFEDKRLHVTASVGVAQLLAGESVEDWIARADAGLYHSKEHGRGCGHWMDGDKPVLIKIAKQNDPITGKPKAARADESRNEADVTRDEADEPNDPEPQDMGAFTGLPGLPELSSEYGEIRERTQAGAAVFVMAITCTGEVSDSVMRSLLQIVRATLRSADRIGCESRSTLLICLPSIDQETAYQRGLQICRSAQSVGIASQGPGENPVAIGVAKSRKTEDFTNAVSRALRLSRGARQEGAEPVCLEGREADA